MGGLIIRSALSEPSIRALTDKFHAYVSLASPHIGTLFSDSQLVSTGKYSVWDFPSFLPSLLLFIYTHLFIF